LPPEEPAGQNPPDGAMIDYWLRSGEFVVTLEIVDAASGKVVRRFSSADKPEPINSKDFNVPMYWVRPARTLSASPGTHRFIWDLTYPAPDVLTRDYPISAIYHDTPLYPLGAAVLPGQYKIVLSVSGKSHTQTLEVKMDPRVKTSPEDLRLHFELDRKIAGSLRRDYEAIQQVRSLRAQLRWLERGKYANSAASSTGLDAAAKIADELEAKAASIEGDEGGHGTLYLDSPEGRSLSRLNNGFNTLVSALDTADAAPTTQQVAMLRELDKALEEQLSAWAQLKTKDIPALNEQLKKTGSPLIDLQKPVPGAEDAAQTTSQDRDKDEE
jgi:hypothetical protein